MKTYFIRTYGCPMNVSDSERLESPLAAANWKRTNKVSKADLVIINTCSVRQKAEDKVYGFGKQIDRAKKANPDLISIVTGCMVNREKRGNQKLDRRLERIEKDVSKRLYWADHVLPTRDAAKLVQKISKNGDKTTDFFSITPKFSSEVTALIPISFGCDNFCSYCVVPYTRGRLQNRPKKEILDEVKSALKKGKKEIYLLGQNVNSWPNFPKLLHEINKLPGEFWIRFISSHPKAVTDDLFKVISEQNHITPYLHFALQSGSDRILKKMNRHYTYKSFKEKVDKIRELVPGIAIATDIIVGFPGETKKDFLMTANAFLECGFEMAYISEYSPRPGTMSAEYLKDDVKRAVKKERKSILNEMLMESNKKKLSSLVGTKQMVLTDRHVKKSEKTYTIARTGTNFEVQIPGKHEINAFLTVNITSATPWALKAKRSNVL